MSTKTDGKIFNPFTVMIFWLQFDIRQQILMTLNLIGKRRVVDYFLKDSEHGELFGTVKTFGEPEREI